MSRIAQILLIESVRQHNLSALEIDPFHLVALNNLGLLEIEFERQDQATEYFERALAVDPTNQTVRTSLDRLRRQN
jgi:Tfp pilus assembly protein PilF